MQASGMSEKAYFYPREGSTVFLSPDNDTVGESFELNVIVAQEAGTLIKTARPIILAQGSVWEKWNYSYSRTAHAGSVFLACPASICLK
jgi:hypothetical protein